MKVKLCLIHANLLRIFPLLGCVSPRSSCRNYSS